MYIPVESHAGILFCSLVGSLLFPYSDESMIAFRHMKGSKGWKSTHKYQFNRVTYLRYT